MPTPVFAQTHIQPGAAYGSAIMEGSALNNQAMSAEREGNIDLAEKLHLEALTVKEPALGPKAVSTALTRNALGELYIKMGRLDDAEDNLKKALEVRKDNGPATDAAVTRDNLGRLYEVKGDLKEARAVRLTSPESMVCSNYKCPGELFTLARLNQCAKCKAVFYCSRTCQLVDWKGRHKKYCKAE